MEVLFLRNVLWELFQRQFDKFPADTPCCKRLRPQTPCNYDKRPLSQSPSHKVNSFRMKVMYTSTRVLEEDLIQAVFDGLSDEDESDNDEDYEIYAFLGAPTVWRADLMVANLDEDEGKDQHEQD